MQDSEFEVNRAWELAQASFNISPELSKSILNEMLESLREERKSIPPHFKHLFCFKCFCIFVQGKTCKTCIRSNRKHPNLKIIEIHCLSCGFTQRINAQKTKEVAPPVTKTLDEMLKQPSRNQQKKRKLMFQELFS